jgi:hypothetical protein
LSTVSIVEMSTLPKEIYLVSAILLKIPVASFAEIGKFSVFVNLEILEIVVLLHNY